MCFGVFQYSHMQNGANFCLFLKTVCKIAHTSKLHSFFTRTGPRISDLDITSYTNILHITLRTHCPLTTLHHVIFKPTLVLHFLMLVYKESTNALVNSFAALHLKYGKYEQICTKLTWVLLLVIFQKSDGLGFICFKLNTFIEIVCFQITVRA